MNGSTQLLRQALSNATETIDEQTLESAVTRMLKGPSAVSQLIEEKIASIMPSAKGEAYRRVVAETAIQCIKWEVGDHADGGIWQGTPVLYGYLDHCMRHASDQLIAECWEECTVATEWKCQTEEYYDFSDGVSLRTRRWLVSSNEKVKFETVIDNISARILARVEGEIAYFTKHLLHHVSLEEWVAAYNTDTQTNNDPKEIQEKVKFLLK